MKQRGTSAAQPCRKAGDMAIVDTVAVRDVKLRMAALPTDAAESNHAPSHPSTEAA